MGGNNEDTRKRSPSEPKLRPPKRVLVSLRVSCPQFCSASRDRTDGRLGDRLLQHPLAAPTGTALQGAAGLVQRTQPSAALPPTAREL